METYCNTIPTPNSFSSKGILKITNESDQNIIVVMGKQTLDPRFKPPEPAIQSYLNCPLILIPRRHVSSSIPASTVLGERRSLIAVPIAVLGGICLAPGSVDGWTFVLAHALVSRAHDLVKDLRGRAFADIRNAVHDHVGQR